MKRGGFKIVIGANVARGETHDVLEHFIRGKIAELRESGVHERCEVDVDAVSGGKGRLFVATIELGESETFVQELSPDVFQALRNAFSAANRYESDRAASGADTFV